MDDKKLHRLNKTELLWIIRDQEAEIEELRKYIKRHGDHPERVGKTDKAVKTRPIDSAGSIDQALSVAKTLSEDKSRMTDKGGVS